MGVVVVVEDDPTCQSVLRAILTRSGWTVFGAETPAEGVSQCQRHPGPIDLFIVDIVLPGGSGTEFAVQIRDSYPGVPILFIFGTPVDFWNNEDHRHLAQLATGSYSLLPKPFTCGMLMQKVNELLTPLSVVNGIAMCNGDSALESVVAARGRSG